MHSIKRRMNLTEVTYSKSREGNGKGRGEKERDGERSGLGSGHSLLRKSQHCSNITEGSHYPKLEKIAKISVHCFTGAKK